MDWTNITVVLTWIIGFGAPAIVAAALSFIAENWPAWANFPSVVKFIVPMIVSVGLSIGASYLLKFPELLAQIQPWFQVLMSAVLAYIASQKTYQGSLQAKYGKRFSGHGLRGD